MFNAKLKLKFQQKTLEIKAQIQERNLKEQRNLYSNVSNAISRNGPGQQHPVHSNGMGKISSPIGGQNGGIFPNARAASTACVLQVSSKFVSVILLQYVQK
jgi:hypothetical protein